MLEFDGRNDAMLHPFDREGRQHMEYLRDRGSHADLPFEDMARVIREYYPHFFDANGEFKLPSHTSFEAEAAAENR